MFRREHIREFLYLATSTGLYQASRLGVGLVAAAALLPAEYGVWGLVLAWLSYTTYANVGILSGANREVPRLLGAGAHSEADQLERSALGATIAVATAILVLGIAIASVFAAQALAVVVLAVVAMSLQQIYLYYQMSLRSRLDFNRASIQQAMLAFVFPIVSLPLLRFGVSALVIGQGAAFVAGAGTAWIAWRRNVRPVFSLQSAIRLARVGVPITISGALYALLTTMDRWITLWLLGDQALGSYTLAALIASALLLVSLVVAQQLYPRMAMRYGARGTAAAIWPMAVRQSLLVFALLLPAVLLIAIAVPLAVAAWLPTYADSIPAIVLLPVGFLILTTGGGFTNLLVVVGRPGIYTASLLVGLAIEAGAALVLTSQGLGITGIALAACLGFAAATTSAAAAAYVISHG